MDLTEAKPVTSEEGVTVTPWTNGWAVGFRITREQDDRVEYVVLNPSGGHNRPDWDGRGDVFVYQAGGYDVDTLGPIDGGVPVVYVDVFEPVAG